MSQRPRIIKDCIYRFVEISPLQKLFMDTPEFQRLRNIKQLGLVSYVFPGACHTRFEHSLGVSHLAGIMIDQLRKTAEISGREKDLVQLAGLWHDCGHVAFSHFFESSFPETHEERGIRLLQQVNRRLESPLEPAEVEQVADMIAGRYQDKKEKAYLYEIVHNPAGIDVDRLDYLQRDSYHTGMPVFQPDYILKHAFVGSTGRLEFRAKAGSEIDRMLECRRLMFQLVYRHPAVQKIEDLFRVMLSRHKIRIEPEMDDVDLMFVLKRLPEFQALCYRKLAEIPELPSTTSVPPVDEPETVAKE